MTIQCSMCKKTIEGKAYIETDNVIQETLQQLYGVSQIPITNIKIFKGENKYEILDYSVVEFRHKYSRRHSIKAETIFCEECATLRSI